MTHPVTITQVCTPTAEAEEDVINSFYTDLQNEVSRAHKNDILIVIGDFSARVRSGERMDYRVMGTYEFRQRNNRREQLLDLCYANDLYISNTQFKQAKPTRCWMWESPDKCTYSQIDYILSSGNSYLASKTADHLLVLT